MGLVIDQDSVEDMLYDLNRDNTNKSIYAKQFGINSLSQQIGQSSIDNAYTKELMNAYQSYLQNDMNANNTGLIDSLRKDVNEYNYDSLSKAYQTSMNTQRNASNNLYGKYLESQGYIGDQLLDLSKAYRNRADSYLDYMKQAKFDDKTRDYLSKIGVITSLAGDVDAEGNLIDSDIFADDSVLRNLMFATEPVYNDKGEIVVNEGDLTEEGKAILNMLQANYAKEDQDELKELSYDAWIENQEAYQDERIDKDMMRKILGIESKYGKEYSKRELMQVSSTYRDSVAQSELKKLDELDIDKNTAYQSISNDSDVRISSKDIESIEEDFNKFTDSITKSLEEYGYTVKEFDDYLKSQGIEYTLEDLGKDSIEEMSKYVVTEKEVNEERGLWISYDTAVSSATAFTVAAAYHYSAAAGCAASALFTFGITAGLSAYHTTQGIVATAGAIASTALANRSQEQALEYGQYLNEKSRSMVDAKKELGMYYTNIKDKFDKFIKGGR